LKEDGKRGKIDKDVEASIVKGEET